MTKARLYTKADVTRLMTEHYPYVTTSFSSSGERWYCNCGAFLDYRFKWDNHVVSVLKKIPGSVEQ